MELRWGRGEERYLTKSNPLDLALGDALAPPVVELRRSGIGVRGDPLGGLQLAAVLQKGGNARRTHRVRRNVLGDAGLTGATLRQLNQLPSSSFTKLTVCNYKDLTTTPIMPRVLITEIYYADEFHIVYNMMLAA